MLRFLARRASRTLPLAIALLLTPPALAQADDAPVGQRPAAQPAEVPSFKGGPVLVIDHVALDKLFVDPKDRPLADALAMIPARIRELPREVPNMPKEAAGVANMITSALSRPGRLAVTYSDNPDGGAFGYGIMLSVLTDGKQDAEQMHARISAMLTAANPHLPTKPSTRFTGMADVRTPVGLLSFGPRQAKDGWRYEVVFGTMASPDAVTEGLPPPIKGLDPVLRARIDFGGINPLFAMGMAFAGNRPDAADAIASLQRVGIGGEHPIKVSIQAGYTPAGSLSVSIIEGAKALGLSTTPLADSDFALIPSDATEAYLARAGADLDKKLEDLVAKYPQAQEGLDKFQQATGVDFKADILGAIGGTVAFYMSDATGGGSLGSSVFVVSLKDRARFASALNKLSAVANMAADSLPIGPGYIRLAAWKDGEAEGTDLLSLRFPGLPVPLELTFATTEHWLIIAPTPQGAIAAARQATGKGDSGLTANRTFTAAFGRERKVTAMSFSDTARNLHSGYPFLSLVGSAIANGVRSPTDPTREPGVLVPPFNDLRRDAKASVSFTYWEGDSLVTEARGDRSVLVRAGGAIGAIGKILPAIAIPAALGAARAQNHHLVPPLAALIEDATPGALAVLELARQAIPELQIQHSTAMLLKAIGVQSPVAAVEPVPLLAPAAQP